MTRVFKFFFYFPRTLIWFWAYTGFKSELSDQKRLKRLLLLRFRNGPKQIVMVQIANTLWRLGRKEEAVSHYILAKCSELDWGGRLNSRVSEYIVVYCNYCIDLIRFGAAIDVVDVQRARFDKLMRISIPDSLKSYKLPMPSSPEGKVY